MQIHNLTGKQKKQKRIGRGGKRGTYSGRGGKGQTARSGHRIRPAIRDFIKQIPKQRGRHKHSFVSAKRKPLVVQLRSLEESFRSGEAVNRKTLVLKGFGDRAVRMKILDDGTKLTKKFTVKDCMVSVGARKAIEAAGGSVADSK